MKRLTRKRGWDSGGVSEIVSTILILGLTVLLFSSIIAFVGRMPAPVPTTQIAFIGRIQPSGIVPWDNGAEIFITHNGGRSLRAVDVKVILTIDGNSTSYPVATTGAITFISPDDTWDPTDVWKISLSKPQVPKGRESTIDASVVDMERNTYVWGSKLQGGNQTYAPLIMDAWADSDPSTAKRDPIQNNLPFTFYVRLSDPNGDLDIGTPTVDMSRLGLGTYLLSEGAQGVFITSQNMTSVVTHAGYYPVTVRATDLAGHIATKVVLLVLGREIGAVPEIHLSIDNVTIDPAEPTNGDDVDIRVKASNIGLGNATVLLEIRDGSASSPVIAWSMFNIGGSPDEVTEMYTWRGAGPGGSHNLFISAVVTSRIPDPDTSDNYINYTLTIMPTILLVDDDAHDGGDLDTTRYMREALDSGGFEYDMYTVPGGSGPAYNSGPTQLVGYDVVIWNTGYESTNTLTLDDQNNLGKYLTDELGGTRTNTGSLWMIGQNFFADPKVSGSAFAGTYLHLSTSGTPALTNPLRGNPAHTVAQNWSDPAKYIYVTTRVAGQGACYRLIPGPDPRAIGMFDRTDSGKDAVSFEDVVHDSRVVTFGWDFGRISDLSVQTDVAYATILWLGNLKEKNVIDFAVTGQTISPQTVYFKQTVTITAWLRNNGDDDGYVSADLALDGVPLADSYRPVILIPGNGGKVSQTWSWNATLPGVHSLIVRADPNDDIAESNEHNNQAGGLVTATTINVLFRLLVVDDDGSSNNGGTLANETGNVTLALRGFGCSHENVTIANGNSFPAGVNMENYSAIIWVSGSAVNSLTNEDVTKLTSYLTMGSGRVWLQGRNATRQLDAGFLSVYFGVDAVLQDQALPSAISGVTGDALGHGILYEAGTGTCDAITPAANGTGYLYQNPALGRYIGLRSKIYPTVVNSFSMDDLANGGWQMPTAIEARQELAFLILDWMGRPETRTELKISSVDVSISDLHPQIGSSYVVRATIRNLAGYTDASALVRFMDENTTIGSDSIGVSPEQTSTAEVIWTPLATGKRTLRVLVDPLGEQAEVFEWFNNNASYSTDVYFFYDDMENGTGKWSHEATLMNINSEGPLDFLPGTYTNVKTDVKKDWDYGAGMTSGVSNSTQYYHSYEESYYMEEPTGVFVVGQTDLLVGIVIDMSKSMFNRVDSNGTSWAAVAKQGALNLISGLSDSSAVSVYSFGGANAIEVIAMTSLSGAGRTAVNSAISALGEAPMTPLWDAVGMAYMSVHDSLLLPLWSGMDGVVVVLGDGSDYKSADNSAAGKLEGASGDWAPWDAMHPELGYPIGTYATHRGKYSYPYGVYGPGLNPGGIWETAGTTGGYDSTRKGLLYSDIPMYTIGLGLEHFATISTPTKNTWTEGAIEHTYARYTGAGSNESGTTEYNLWRMANTSHGEYFYCENADSLIGTFGEIGTIIGSGSGFNQTRSVPAQPSPNAANEDKQAISPAVDLSSYETAKLSFSHKYNMLPGGNGGVIGVEVRDPPVFGSWKFLYIIPSGVYTGGLYYGYHVDDDFGNQIKWCFNGVSGGGTFAWDHIGLDVMPFIEKLGADSIYNDPDAYKGSVRVAFKYIQFGGGTGIGWYIDDVQLNAGRGDTTLSPADVNMKDVWDMNDTLDHHGAVTHAWWNRNPSANGLKPGIDNSLTTIPIDLTNAVTVTLGAYFRFNINTAEGIPPDCVRVEVTPDGGASWYAINLGVRGVWGMSGTGPINTDGKSYTGVNAGGNWVEAGTLARLNVDLSAWRGKQIQLRIRIVTNNDAGYAHYATNASPWGVYIDDVILTGLTKYS
jgi:hypothetical protein